MSTLSSRSAIASRACRRLIAVVLLAALGLYVATPAGAATGRAQVTMPCHMTYDDGSENEGETLNFGVAIDLTVPESVSPGQVVALKGMLTIQAPEELRKRVEGFIDSFEGASDSASVGLTINGSRKVYFADRWQSGRQPVGNPMVAKAPITLPAFQVPANASGQIVIDLPRNDVIKNPYTKDGPPVVAVFAKVVARSNAAGDYPYSMACWRSDKGAGVIASIPVVAPGGAAPENGGPSQPGASVPGQQPTDTGTGSQTQTPGVGNPGGADTPNASGPGAATADPFGAPGIPAGATAQAPSTSTTGSTTGMTPLGYGAGQDTNGLFVPTWLLVMVGFGVAVGGGAYAVWLQLRLRALRNAADR